MGGQKADHEIAMRIAARLVISSRADDVRMVSSSLGSDSSKPCRHSESRARLGFVSLRPDENKGLLGFVSQKA
jgi:hypothetical protein